MFDFDPYSGAAFCDFVELADAALVTAFIESEFAWVAEMLAEEGRGRVILYTASVSTTLSDNPFAEDTIEHNPLVVNAVVTGYSSARVDGKSILMGDVRILLDPTEITTAPKKGQRVSVDARLFSIVEVKPILAAGIPALYIVQARTAN